MRTRTCLRQAIAAAAVLGFFIETTRADYVLYRDVVLADSPVAYWRLDETGSPFVSQVGAYSGSDVGHVVTTGISGPQAAAYLGFESGNQGVGVANTPDNVVASNYISVNHAAALNPGAGNWSVEAWIYIPSTDRPTSGESWIVAKMGTTAGNYVRDGYALSFNFGTLRPSLTVRDSDNTYADAVLGVSGPALATDTWYHLVATLERGTGTSATVKMYVNSTAGSTVNSASSAVLDKPLESVQPLAIGSSSNGRYGFWGQIDEVAVYNRALTAAQVAAHFAAAEFDPATRYWSGAGEWNTTNTNWGTQSGTHSGTAWGVGVNDAVFEGTGGTVTITEALPMVHSLAFHADGYTLSGGSLRLAGEAAVATVAGVTARINSTVTGAASLTKTGAGTLVLGGPATYAGDTTVEGGTLILGSVANANYAS
ncbi:MAG: LamG-like jellyroll fold domain-containing protein, partial [Patescibacteria group bacterium]|nr:LamG-like jellyroll fold domain-containing protein [Patescibacteria group bacterium]